MRIHRGEKEREALALHQQTEQTKMKDERTDLIHIVDEKK
jgi:hypothetical protein